MKTPVSPEGRFPPWQAWLLQARGWSSRGLSTCLFSILEIDSTVSLWSLRTARTYDREDD